MDKKRKTAASFKATPGPTKTVRQVAEFNNGSRTIDHSKVAWIKHDKTSASFNKTPGPTKTVRQGSTGLTLNLKAADRGDRKVTFQSVQNYSMRAAATKKYQQMQEGVRFRLRQFVPCKKQM